MLHPASSSYPSTTDIGYAAWLKRLATQLPGVANRYQVSATELEEVHRTATEFIEWLLHRTHCATRAIQQRQYLTAVAFYNQDSQQVSQTQYLLARISALVQHIQQHPAYCPDDAATLGLVTIPSEPNLGSCFCLSYKPLSPGPSAQFPC